MISKKLFEEIINKEIEDMLYSEFNNSIEYKIKTKPKSSNIYMVMTTYMNIYELANKAKKWAVKNGYQISSTVRINAYPNAVIYEENNLNIIKQFKSDTEYEAIFDACEWIIESKTLKDK